jgi:hypothetical protein
MMRFDGRPVGELGEGVGFGELLDAVRAAATPEERESANQAISVVTTRLRSNRPAIPGTAVRRAASKGRRVGTRLGAAIIVTVFTASASLAISGQLPSGARDVAAAFLAQMGLFPVPRLEASGQLAPSQTTEEPFGPTDGGRDARLLWMPPPQVDDGIDATHVGPPAVIKPRPIEPPPVINPPPGVQPPPVIDPRPGVEPPPVIDPPPGVQPPPVIDPPPGVQPPPVIDPSPGDGPPPAVDPGEHSPPADDEGQDTPPADDQGEDTPPADDEGEDSPPVVDPGDEAPPEDDQGEDSPPADDPGENPPPDHGPPPGQGPPFDTLPGQGPPFDTPGQGPPPFETPAS